MSSARDDDEVTSGHGLRAGTVTTSTLAILAASVVVTLVADDGAGGSVLLALVLAGLYIFFCLLPLGLLDRGMRVSTVFSGALLTVAVALGGFALTIPVKVGGIHRAALPRLFGVHRLSPAAADTWQTVGTIAMVVAVCAAGVGYVAVLRMRGQPGWKASPKEPIGFFAEGRRRGQR